MKGPKTGWVPQRTYPEKFQNRRGVRRKADHIERKPDTQKYFHFESGRAEWRGDNVGGGREPSLRGIPTYPAAAGEEIHERMGDGETTTEEGISKGMHRKTGLDNR